jgi:hypothetical protein
MWQMFLVPVSIVLLISTLIPSLRDGTRAQKVVNQPDEELDIIYPTDLYPVDGN